MSCFRKKWYCGKFMCDSVTKFDCQVIQGMRMVQHYQIWPHPIVNYSHTCMLRHMITTLAPLALTPSSCQKDGVAVLHTPAMAALECPLKIRPQDMKREDVSLFQDSPRSSPFVICTTIMGSQSHPVATCQGIQYISLALFLKPMHTYLTVPAERCFQKLQGRRKL